MRWPRFTPLPTLVTHMGRRKNKFPPPPLCYQKKGRGVNHGNFIKNKSFFIENLEENKGKFGGVYMELIR